jgi:hypothetical protein
LDSYSSDSSQARTFTVDESYFWQVSVDAIQIRDDGTYAYGMNPATKAIFDSGTSFIYFPARNKLSMSET